MDSINKKIVTVVLFLLTNLAWSDQKSWIAVAGLRAGNSTASGANIDIVIVDVLRKGAGVLPDGFLIKAIMPPSLIKVKKEIWNKKVIVEFEFKKEGVVLKNLWTPSFIQDRKEFDRIRILPNQKALQGNEK